jgi:hypothetical protein
MRALRDNFMMYVLQSCNACTILGASCNTCMMWQLGYGNCAGTAGWWQDISGIYRLSAQIKIWHIQTLPKGREDYGTHSSTKVSVRTSATASQRCPTAPNIATAWHDVERDRTTAARLNCNCKSIARRPCFHLTAALQTFCDNDFFKIEILSYDVSSYVTAWKNILNNRAVAFCCPSQPFHEKSCQRHLFVT